MTDTLLTRLTTGVALLSALSAVPAASAGAQADHLLVVTGAPGEPRFTKAFHEAAATFVQAARTPGGLPAANVRYLAGSAPAPAGATGRATRDGVQGAIRDLAAKTRAGDAVTIVLIGHGSMTDDVSRFNLPGPDVSATEMAAWLRPLAERRLTIVVAASASGDWMPALAAPGRVVITATRTGMEANEITFHTHFAAAYRDAAADADKDGRVSVLEAFTYANREVARGYESTGRLQTEHALLDDNGDGKGIATPAANAADGRMASRAFLGAAPDAARVAGRPGAEPLLRERAQVEQAVETLRGRKASMPAAEYDRQLEALITRLAEIRQALARLDGGR